MSFLKKIFIGLGVLLLAVGLSQPKAHAATFKDVTYTHWAYEDIQFVAKHKIINGYAGGLFRPGVDIKRKDAVTMMIRTLDLQDDVQNIEVEDEVEEEVSPFEDMFPWSPGYREVSWAIQEDWLTVDDDNNFNPNDPLTRDEMSKMLATIYQYEGEGKSTFIDVEKSNVYYPYIDAIASYGVTTGYQDKTFRPEEKVTRAQFSALLARVYQQPVAYEVKSANEVVAVVPSVEKALKEVANYSDGTIHPQSNKFVTYSQEIGTADQTGIQSSVLIYNGAPPEKNDFTPEFFDHYLKTTTDTGEEVDLFETFVILGLRYNLAGNQFVDGLTNQANYEDWNDYIQKTFAADGVLYNLNESAIQNDRDADVYIAIPYPKRFGEIITLDGRELVNNFYSRYDLTRWYIEKVFKEFERSNYDNLNFKGFYWLSETVRTVDDGVLISSISSMIKNRGKHFIYSPHATSTNFYKWQDYGFDGAFLQPNAFRTDVTDKEERLHKAYLKAQIYGTGITMEIDSYGLNQVEQGYGDEAFDLYIDFAKRYGLNDKGMMFYQGTNMVERMATIDHPIYQKWYKQLNETFFYPKPY